MSFHAEYLTTMFVSLNKVCHDYKVRQPSHAVPISIYRIDMLPRADIKSLLIHRLNGTHSTIGRIATLSFSLSLVKSSGLILIFNHHQLFSSSGHSTPVWVDHCRP